MKRQRFKTVKQENGYWLFVKILNKNRKGKIGVKK